MKTAVEVLLAVADISGKLSIVDNKLAMGLPAGCPPELKDAIRGNKPALLELLRLNFLIVRSDALKGIVFWTPDDATKDVLVAAGADSSSIYTAAELQEAVHRGVTADDLRSIHAGRRIFSGSIKTPPCGSGRSHLQKSYRKSDS